MESAEGPLCERGVVEVETRREKYAGRLALLRRFLPVTVSSFSRSLSSLAGAAISSDFLPWRRPERMEAEDEGAAGIDGASDMSSS